MTQFKFYLVTEDGYVKGTDDPEISEAALCDGCTTIIDYVAGTSGFDGITAKIESAVPEDWLKSEDDEDGDGT